MQIPLLNFNTSNNKPFTCSKPLGVFTKKITHPKNLSVTIEKAEKLVLKALKFEQGRSTGSTLYPDGRVVEDRPYIRREKDIELGIPFDFEPNQKYTLALTSISGFGFSAKLVKNKGTNPPISETSEGGGETATESYREGAEKFKKTGIENSGGASTDRSLHYSADLARLREKNKGTTVDQEVEAFLNSKTISYSSLFDKP